MNKPDIFQLNGQKYTSKQLFDYAQTIVNQEDRPEWEKILYGFIIDWLSKSWYIEVQTSGSTGTPKKISLEKRRMMKSAEMTGTYFDLHPDDNALLCLPCDYIAGKMMVVRAFELGLDLITVAPSLNPLETVDQPIDFAAMIPQQVLHILEEDPSKFRYIQKLIIGGGAVKPDLQETLQGLLTHCYATYGMTETITHIAIKPLNYKSKSYFEALPNVHFSQDDRKCLVINVPYLSDIPVVTNDVVELCDSTKFEWLGRFDNVINTGGIKVCPEQLEAKLAAFVLRRFFVASVADVIWENKIVLIIEGREWTLAQQLLLKNALKKEFPKHEVPKLIYFCPTFAETPTGKIQRFKTMELVGIMNGGKVKNI